MNNRAVYKMQRMLPFLVILLLLLFISSGYSADPAKNYELLPLWQKSAPSLFPVDVNSHTPGDEILILYENQIDILSNVSLMHQKSIIVPADKKYLITPLPGLTPDSLRLLFGCYMSTTAAFDLYLCHNDTISAVKKNCLFFSRRDRDRDGWFHQSLSPIALFNNR